MKVLKLELWSKSCVNTARSRIRPYNTSWKICFAHQSLQTVQGWGENIDLCVHWELCTWKFVICDNATAKHISFLPRPRSVTEHCCLSLVLWLNDRRQAALMVCEYDQLISNDTHTSAADRPQAMSHCVCFPAAYQPRHTYEAVLGFIPLGGRSENTVNLAHRTSYCWGSRARRAMNAIVDNHYSWGLLFVWMYSMYAYTHVS